MKNLLHQNQRDAIRNLRRDCPLMAYVRATYTPEVRSMLDTFRPAVEDIYREVAGLVDEWRRARSTSHDASPMAQYAPFEGLADRLVNDYRDIAESYRREDCTMVARVVVAMLTQIFGTMRPNGVEYYTVAKMLTMQLIVSFGSDTEALAALYDRFATRHSEGIGEWTIAYLGGDEWIGEDIETIIKIIEEKMKEEKTAGGLTLDKEDLFRLLREQKPNVTVNEGGIANLEGSNPVITQNIYTAKQNEPTVTITEQKIVEAMREISSADTWEVQMWWAVWKVLMARRFFNTNAHHFANWLVDKQLTDGSVYDNIRRLDSECSKIAAVDATEWAKFSGKYGAKHQKQIDTAMRFIELLDA